MFWLSSPSPLPSEISDGSGKFPSLHKARRGGCVLNKMSRSHRKDAAGVVFLFSSQSENHPGLAAADTSRHFIDRSATPPCVDARRGICRSHTFRHFSQPHRRQVPKRAMYHWLLNSHRGDQG